ncbi:MAG TPA: hypothetical protein VHX42_04460 [Candidatus Babeliales bacterium]|jgi:hypothetical protein|nr:hypothetical protein [Candidatus Babeliales bacterium]
MKNNTKSIIIVFSAITITFQICAMEATQQLILSQQRYYQALSKKEHPYKNQILPDDIFDKIIAYSSREVRKNLKEVCTQLAYLTSINRLDKFIIHDFVIGDKKERTIFFEKLIKTNNPDLITSIITHAKKEAVAQKYFIPDTVFISIDPEEKKHQKEIQKQQKKEYTKNIYLTPLLEEAIKQHNDTMIKRLETENIDQNIIRKHREGRTITKFAISIVAVVLTSVVGGAIAFSYIQSHCTYNFYGCTIPCGQNACCEYQNGNFTPC